MKIFRFENLIFEVNKIDAHTEVFTVTHNNNKFFGTQFTRYSATSYQLTKEYVPLSQGILNCELHNLPYFDANFDKWTQEFVEFICNSMSYIGIFEHLVNCPFVTVWNDNFEVYTTCTLNIMNGEVTNIETPNISTDYEGNPLTTLHKQFIIYSDEYNSRLKLDLVECANQKKIVKSFLKSKKVL